MKIKLVVLLCLGFFAGFLYSLMQAAEPVNDISPAEWAAIEASEEKIREEHELQEAVRLSLEAKTAPTSGPEQQAQSKKLKQLYKPSLPKLTDEDMEASMGARYSSDSVNFGRLHDQGHKIDQAFLLQAFLGSLFQYYTHSFIGIDMTYNYDSKPVDARADDSDIEKFYSSFRIPVPQYPFKIKSKNMRELRDILRPHISYIVKAVNSLKSNVLLQKLGIAYMRLKIILEKFKSDDFARLMRDDRDAVDVQTMIYHFMSQAYGEYMARVQKDVGVLRLDNKKEFPSSDFLATFVPSFINDPYYAPIIARLDELGNPVTDL